MSANNGAPPFSRGLEIELEWRGQRIVAKRPNATAHNAWTPLIHQWPQIDPKEPVPDSLLQASIEALRGHVLKVDGRVVEDIEAALVALEIGDLLIQVWIAATPRGPELGESDAPSA